MIREHIFSSRTPTDPHFRWRGGDVSRLEGLSDAAFAFAMTMMVIDSFRSIESYAQLRDGLTQIPALIACFAILFWIWGIHYRFFRRFGLEDSFTIFLNSVLLLVVMVYAFLLKYLFKGLFAFLMGRKPEDVPPMGGEVLQIYGAGFVIIFLLIAGLVHHGYRQREQLQLDEVEIYITRASRRDHLLTASTGLLSIAITIAGPWFMAPQLAMPIAGMSYALNGPIHWWHGVHVERHVLALEKRLAATTSTDPTE